MKAAAKRIPASGYEGEAEMSSMMARFQGAEGRRRLIEALKSQRVLENEELLAISLADEGELCEFAVGAELTCQGDTETDAFFIIDGEVNVYVNTRHVAIRGPRETIGEMTLIDSSVRRAATVTAHSRVTALRITEPKFRQIAENNAKVWRMLAIVAAERLRQRNQFHRPPNERPVLFIGSSVEGIKVAEEIELRMKHNSIKVRPWNAPGVFGPGGVTIDTLLREVDSSDFAVFVFGPDDKVFSRQKKYEAPRDNVIFELGLFMGRLDRHRSLIVKDQHADIKIPSDLLGITPINYSFKGGGDLTEAIGPACIEIRKIVDSVGVR